jgi:hypothetical protein
MTVKTGATWASAFSTLDATGAKLDSSVGPSGTLYVNGIANSAAVSIVTGSNPYKWSVTLPSLSAGDRVQMYAIAVISGITTVAFVADEQADTLLNSDVANAVWDDGLSNNTTTGTAGYILSQILNDVDNIAIVGAPAYEAPSSYVLSTGTQTAGTYQSVDTSNGVYHTHTDSGGLLSLYYEYSLKSDEEAVGIVFKGRITSSNDSVFIQAYDWVNSVWVSVHTLVGTNTTTDTNVSSALVSKYTGTGLNSGKVRIRFINAVTLTTATLYIDQMIIGKTITGRSVGYADGAIWIDDTTTNTNTVAFIDGTADNPVSTWAAALTLSASTNLKRFRLTGNTSIILSALSAGYEIVGGNVNLGSQNVSSSRIYYSTITGIQGAGTALFEAFNCVINAVSGLWVNAWNCKLRGSMSIAAGSSHFFSCGSAGPTTGYAPTFDVSAGNSTIGMRLYSGKLTVDNLTTGDILSFDSPAGQLILNASCTGGEVRLRGMVDFVNGGTGITVTRDGVLFDVTTGHVYSDGYVNVTGTVVASSVTGNVGGSVNSVVNPVTVSGYVLVTGTPDVNVEKWNTVDVVSNAIPAFAAGGAGGLPTVNLNNYVAGIQGTKNQLDDLNDIAAGTQMDLINIPNATAITAFTDDIFVEAVEGTTTFRQWLRRMGAVLFGKASGGGVAGSKKFRNTLDTKDRVDATTTVNGDRTSVSFDDT